MALVQYDFGSSDSETENDNTETTEVSHPLERQVTEIQQNLVLKPTELEKDNNELHVSKKIKIAIPKILDDKIDDDIDDETMIPKISRINSNETSGLLTKLPPPKSAPTKKVTTTSFVPHAVNRKPIQNNKMTVKKAKMAKAKLLEKSKKDDLAAILDNEDSDDDDDDDISSISTNFDEEIWSQVCGRRKKDKNIQPVISETVISDEILENEPSEESASLKLDNAAFKQLVGSSKRQQKLNSDITITDIDEADILQKTDVWMRKALTDPQYQQKPSNDSDDSSNPVAKNKHHITFLAQQAKAKEQELQAQWASGNQKRQMSRAKYGF